MKASEHKMVIDVRVCDTDLVGSVAHSRYFEWFSTGRVEFYKQQSEITIVNGMPRILGAEDYVVVLAHIDADFYKPLYFDDRVILVTSIAEVKTKAIVFDQSLWKGKKLVAKAKAVHVCVDAKTLTSAELPKELVGSLRRG